MTDFLFQTDSYLQSFDGLIIGQDVENHVVILDRTAFYPGGGGQPADSGSLTVENITCTVKRAKKSGDDVIHILDGSDPLPTAGSTAHGEIDWERRYQLMRTHTAMHIAQGSGRLSRGAATPGGIRFSA